MPTLPVYSSLAFIPTLLEESTMPPTKALELLPDLWE
jgi:hypothetical protein